MLGKIAGAIVGKRTARHFEDVSGPFGAVLGVGAAAVLKRAGPLGLLAALVGGYVLKRHRNKTKHRSGYATPGGRDRSWKD